MKYCFASNQVKEGYSNTEAAKELINSIKLRKITKKEPTKEI